MVTIGKRLKEERLKLNLSQDKLAKIGGVTKRTQVNYEQDSSKPDGEYLSRVAKEGINIQYVLCGEKECTPTKNNSTNEILSSMKSKLETFEQQIQDMKSMITKITDK